MLQVGYTYAFPRYVDKVERVRERRERLCCSERVIECDFNIISAQTVRNIYRSNKRTLGQCSTHSLETRVWDIPYAQMHPSAPFSFSRRSGGYSLKFLCWMTVTLGWFSAIGTGLRLRMYNAEISPLGRLRMWFRAAEPTTPVAPVRMRRMLVSFRE